MSLRELRVLIQHLPPESATITAIRNATPDVMDGDSDAAEGRWSQHEMLLAALVDEARLLRWVYVASHTEKAPPKQPEPVRRPGLDRKARKPKLSPKQADFLFRHINGLPQDPDVHLTVIRGGGGQ